MTCTSCGDKPKGSSKGFPRAVVEINNPESLVLLRKVVIPVSMGTEEDVPPAIGKYFNVLLQYESNGHIYLYSSDGIPTAIEANIPQEVLDRIDQLEIDVDLLETGLANETTAREAADTALGGRIDTVADNLATETANRISADEELQADITAEATARANADTNLQNQITQEAQARAAADTAINGAITAEASTRQTADAGLQSQIDAITASSDVKDIVGTKAELNNYDTSTLGNNDIIKVLQDESENDATTYYRWNATTQQFTLIGEEGPYYTKSQADTLLNAKQNTLTAGSNVQIVNDTISATDTTYTAGTGLALNGTQFSVDTTAIATQSDLTAGLATKQDTLTAGTNIQINNNTISATDTTYSNFTGTDGSSAGAAGLVPAPATTDAGKFLKADGTWGSAGGGGGAEFIELTTADYNWNSSTGQTGTPNCVALWLLPSGIYKGPASTSIEVRATRGQEYSMGAGYPCYVIVKECENTDTNRAIVTYVDAGNGNVVEYCNIDENGRNYTVKNFPNVVQTTGTSTTNVMSQKAVTDMIAPRNSDDALWINNPKGSNPFPATLPNYSVTINPTTSGTGGSGATATSAIAINGTASGHSAISIGINSSATQRGSIALGRGASATSVGEMNIGTNDMTAGYNSTNYRLLSGVHDAQSDNDAVNLGQLNGRVLQNAGAPTTSTVGTVGQLLEDTTNGKLYQCTDATNPYVWEEVGAGAGASAFTNNEWNALWA